jgi:hypothetical protein
MDKKRALSTALIAVLLLVACSPTEISVSTPVTSPYPSPKVEPTTPATPAVTAVPTPLAQAITIAVPQSGAAVSSPVQVSGQVAVVPFESNLRGRVLDAAGRVLGEGPIMVQGSMGQPGPAPFSGQIAFTAGGSAPGKVQVADLSPKDGSVIASAAVDVTLQGTSVAGTIEVPAAGTKVTLPLHILARVGQPGEEVVAGLYWQDGSVLTRTYTLIQGENGGGLLIESLWWNADIPPLPFPPTQPATLKLSYLDGTALAQQQVTVVSWDDPTVKTLTVYFLLGETPTAVQVKVPETVRVGTAALEELLWGPPPPNLAGFATALPLPPEVLSYPGRTPDWGPRVRLLSLKIENGVATADFSRELKAYGGGSLRVQLIRQQITLTLKQFPTVQTVVIAIEGETEAVLEP